MDHQTRNIVDFGHFCRSCRNSLLEFTVSSRSIRPDFDLLAYLKTFYIYLHIGQIVSVFGSTSTASPLYGGRPYKKSHSLNQAHLSDLEKKGIGLDLTLTNHLFSKAAYDQSLELLDRHHRPGNSIICVSDALARRIRKDFPQYTLKASMIKNLTKPAEIRDALELYDDVTLPMEKNDDDDFLMPLPFKHRILLFGNATCAYTCPDRTCYRGHSQRNQGRTVSYGCSQKDRPRENMGLVYFNIKKLSEMGFIRFKLIPSSLKAAEAVARRYSNKNNNSHPKIAP